MTYSSNQKKEILDSAVNEVVISNDFQFAWKLYGFLTDNKAEYGPEHKKILQWIALPFFKKEEILSIFRNNFQTALELKYFNIWDKLKHALVCIPLHENRDQLKLTIKEELNKNQAMLTNQKMLDGKIPSVENWIKHYTAELGIGPVEKVKVQQFFISDKEVTRLDQEEKTKVINFFIFYERLKHSSLTVTGIEDVIPVNAPQFQGYIENGQLSRPARLSAEQERIFKVVVGENEDKKIIELQQKDKEYKDGSLQKLAVKEELERTGKLKKMKDLADSFPSDSLQRKVVLEEIDKMNRQ